MGLVFIFIYITGAHNEGYWKKRGVYFSKENPVMGPMLNFLLQDRPLFQVFGDLYKKHPNEPAIGIGSFWTPSILIKDPTNIYHVLQTDFNSFNHRGMEPLDGDKLSDNILFQNGVRWKMVRQSMTPIFTSAKLKNMYYIIDKSAQDFIVHLKDHPEKLEENLFETLSSFCSAAISAAVFGIDTESVFDSPLLNMARKSTAPSLKTNIKFVFNLLLPKLSKMIGLQVFKEHEDFFIGAIRKVIEDRKASKVKMHDFADLCLSIEEKGTMIDKNTNYKVEPSVDLFAAQAFFFFIAGVEPCALAGRATLLELGRHPEYLKQVHEEIDAAFREHGQLTFDVINSLEVLEKVYTEALRIHPPVGTLTRQCSEDSVLPVGNIKIDKGTQIFLPIYNIHHDEKHYPNPSVFDPERWSQGANKDLYMPFGKGNRLCIGARYATLQVKAGLVHLLRHYTVEVHQILSGPPKYVKHMIQVNLTNFEVKLVPRYVK